MRVGLSLLIFLWTWIGSAQAEEPARQTWERVGLPSTEAAVVAVAADPARPARMVSATRHAVLESVDEGATWVERLRTPQAAVVTAVAVEPAGGGTVLAATERGLYGSTDGKRWQVWFRGMGEAQRCTRALFHPMSAGVALLGTEDGLYLSRDHGRHWQPVLLPFSARQVSDLAFAAGDPNRVYLVAADGVYVGQLDGNQWERRFSAFRPEAPGVEGPDVVASQTAEETGSLHRLSALATDPQDPNAVYVASGDDLQVSRDAGASWEPMAHPALGPLAHLLLQRRSPMVLYAATAEGIARYDSRDGAWSTWTEGALRSQVHALAASRRYLWAATDEGLMRLPLPPEPVAEQEPLPSPKELLGNFSHEPGIGTVRDAAIRYAEVHPDKLKWWRRQSALQALLPKFTVGFDNKRSSNIHFDEGTFPKFQLVETRDRDNGLDFSVNWDLGELLWNDQTAIDARSKLLVELRRDIVEEITRVYFERRRIQIALLTDPPPMPAALVDQELRVQELTARLDGLTGGYFSTQIWTPSNQQEGAWTQQ